MAEASPFLSSKRYAVVTGGNKGIGFEICRQLASKGIKVVVTARNEKRGLQAVDNLIKEFGLSPHLLVFHQLDVTDSASAASLADFVKTQFGKLDILVNNAATLGADAHSDAFLSAVQESGGWSELEGKGVDMNEYFVQTYETAEECLNTNYYGYKRMVEALVPVLQLSDSPRIVNVSSFLGMLKYMPNEKIKAVLSDVESLTEEKIDEIWKKLLQDVKDGKSLEKEGWPQYLSAYMLSKISINSYSRILAKKYPTMMVNCVDPGFVKTDINCNAGTMTVNEGGGRPVKVALLPHGSSTGLFYRENQVSSF
ncbi:hypothetical protein ACOSQ2_021843 [Xanthoceras sorbifolium]